MAKKPLIVDFDDAFEMEQAFINAAGTGKVALVSSTENNIVDLPIELIDFSEHQPRIITDKVLQDVEKLAKSIETNGQIYPIVALHIALTAIGVEVDHKGRGHRFIEGRQLDVHVSLRHSFALGAVHEIPGGANRQANRQQHSHDDQDNQLEFAFNGGVFYCVARRHANNPSLFGFHRCRG